MPHKLLPICETISLEKNGESSWNYGICQTQKRFSFILWCFWWFIIFEFGRRFAKVRSTFDMSLNFLLIFKQKFLLIFKLKFLAIFQAKILFSSTTQFPFSKMEMSYSSKWKEVFESLSCKKSHIKGWFWESCNKNRIIIIVISSYSILSTSCEL